MANHLHAGIVPASAVGLLVVATLLLPPRSAAGQYRVGTDGYFNDATTRPGGEVRSVNFHHIPIDVATHILTDTDEFVGPSVRFSGFVPKQYTACYEVLVQPDAADRFDRLTRSAHLAGQLYGLLGLRQTDPRRYAKAVHGYEQSDAVVKTSLGDRRGPMTVKAIIAEWRKPTTAPTTRP